MCFSKETLELISLSQATTSHWTNWQYRANKVKQVSFHFFCFRLSKSCSSGSSVSFVVSNGAEYYDQINMTALWDKLKKKKNHCCKLNKLNKGLRIFFFLKEGIFSIQNPKVLEIKCYKTELLLSENRFPALSLKKRPLKTHLNPNWTKDFLSFGTLPIAKPCIFPTFAPLYVFLVVVVV